MAKRDYYEILGLKKGSSKEEIKRAYRKLAKELHPDRNKEKDAESKFTELQEAYEVLSDEQKRSAYDQYGFAGTQGFGGAAGSPYGGFSGFDQGSMGDLGDIFSSFFGSSFGGFGYGSPRRTQERGSNIEAKLKIEFSEAVFGAEKVVHYRRRKLCGHCSGTGAEGGRKERCANCGGSGQIQQVFNTFVGAVRTNTVCPVCEGVGEVIAQKCAECGGEGRKMEDDSFAITVPPGIPDEVTLRFRGKGHAGKRGGEAGDLFVSIEVMPHPRLERRGDDVYLDQSVDVATAVLGGEVAVPTVHGEVTMKVPGGTQPGAVIRLRGKGGPRFKSRGNGDQYVRVLVDIPKKVSSAQRKIWESLR